MMSYELSITCNPEVPHEKTISELMIGKENQNWIVLNRLFMRNPFMSSRDSL
jgi:hypothetical protein